jgi:putative drug exporter of the RND superfamily
MFFLLGQWIARQWWAVILAWIAVALALRMAAPRWDAIAHDGNLAYLPAEMTSAQGERLLREAFPQNTAKSQVIAVLARDDRPLDAVDLAVADRLAERFTEAADELGVQEVWTYDLRVIGEKLKSADGKAVLIVLQMTGEFMAVENIRILNRVVEIVDAERAEEDYPAGLQLGVTGSAAVGGDMLSSAAESIRNTEWTTIAMVVVFLLLVYGAPMLVVVPVATIGISVSVGLSVVALLTQADKLPGFDWWNFKVFTTTRIFIVVILFGSGTDFCLFLIARYKEELERGLAQREALAAALG